MDKRTDEEINAQVVEAMAGWVYDFRQYRLNQFIKTGRVVTPDDYHEHILKVKANQEPTFS